MRGLRARGGEDAAGRSARGRRAPAPLLPLTGAARQTLANAAAHAAPVASPGTLAPLERTRPALRCAPRLRALGRRRRGRSEPTVRARLVARVVPHPTPRRTGARASCVGKRAPRGGEHARAGARRAGRAPWALDGRAGRRGNGRGGREVRVGGGHGRHDRKRDRCGEALGVQGCLLCASEERALVL